MKKVCCSLSQISENYKQIFSCQWNIADFLHFSQRRKFKVTQVSGTSEMYLGFCQNIYDEAFSPEIVKLILKPPEKWLKLIFSNFVVFLLIIHPNNPSLWFWPQFPKNIKKYFFRSFYKAKVHVIFYNFNIKCLPVSHS